MSIQLCLTNFPSTTPLVSFPNTFSKFHFPVARTKRAPTISRHFTNFTSTVPPVGQNLPENYADWLPVSDPSQRRRAGILLHPTSFQSPYGIGDLGEQAFRFIDWLHLAGCSLWQVYLSPPCTSYLRVIGSGMHSVTDPRCYMVLHCF